MLVHLEISIHLNPAVCMGRMQYSSSQSPTYKSYAIASYISKNTGTSLITYKKAGVEYPGALEDECNLHGIPAVTCEVLETHGTVSSDKLNKSYCEIMALLTYYHIL